MKVLLGVSNRHVHLNEEDYKDTPALNSEEKDITPEEKK